MYYNFLESDKILVATYIFIITIFSLTIYLTSFDKIAKNKLLDEIPSIIKLAQRVEYIQNYIDFVLNYYSNDSLVIIDDITDDTKLSESQINLLSFIKELEKLDEIWDFYKNNNIFNNNNIKMPYAIAYNIRELLETPIKKDNDNEDFVWLNKSEIECLEKYKINSVEPSISKLKSNDQVIICIKCKEALKYFDSNDISDAENELKIA